MQNAAIAIETPTAEINRQSLTDAVEIVSKIVAKNAHIDALSCAHIIASNDRTVIKGTDCDTSISVTVKSLNTSNFAAITPCDRLKAILKKATKSDIAVLAKENDDEIGIDLVATKFSLNDYNASDDDVFPSPVRQYTSQFLMRGADLLKLITNTKDAISTEETRYYLNGIYVLKVDGKLRFVATDGHRLFIQDIDAPNGCLKSMPKVIMPRKMIKILFDLIKGKNTPDEIWFSVHEHRVKFSWTQPDGNRVEIESKVIDGTFPDYNRVIPSDCEREVMVKSAEFVEAISNARLVLSKNSRGVKLTPTQNRLLISTFDKESGSAFTHVDATSNKSTEMEIGVDISYLMDALNVANSRWIKMQISDPSSPMIITGSNDGWMAVQMPMRL